MSEMDVLNDSLGWLEKTHQEKQIFLTTLWEPMVNYVIGLESSFYFMLPIRILTFQVPIQ